MSTDVPDQVDVRGLAAVINSRLAAESRVAKAKAFGWLCGGAAIAFTLTGVGVALALYGYSFTFSVDPAGQEIAKALGKALEQAQLKTSVTGTMSLSPDSEVKLAAGQKIALENDAIVKLDPNSTVRVVGDLKIDMPQPSKHQLQLDTTSNSKELPFTDYTIFRSLSFGTGQVVTGWSYDLSDMIRPRAQYCYYTQSIEKGVAAKYTIAFDGSPRRPSPLAKVSFNFDGALANCIWFSGY